MFIIDRNEIIEDSEPEWEAMWRKESEDNEIHESLDTSLGRKRSVLCDLDAVRSANTNVVAISASCSKPTDTDSNVNIISSRFACFAHDPTRAGTHAKTAVLPSLSRTSSSASIKSQPVENDPPQNQAQNKSNKRRRTTQIQPKSTNVSQSQPEITESDVTHMTKCVTCDIKWTTRKSSRQKFSHMRSCARKMGVNWDVVERVVRKELANIQISHAKNGRGKDGAEKEVQRPPQTLLEDTVKDVEPNKKRKRAEVVTSVKPVEESHGIINNRAKMLLARLNSSSASLSSHQKPNSSKSSVLEPVLGPGPKPIAQACIPPPPPFESNDFSHPPSTQQFAPSRLPNFIHPLPNPSSREPDADNDTNILPPSTQPFGMSRLALNFPRAIPASSSIHDFSVFDDQNDFSNPPSTQAFAPSKLSGIIRHLPDTGTDGIPPSTQPFGMSRFAFAQPSQSVING